MVRGDAGAIHLTATCARPAESAAGIQNDGRPQATCAGT